MKESEIILASLSGEDKPGVTAALTAVLADHNANILDIGQANIHHSLSLAIMFEATNAGDVIKDLLFKATELGVVIRFSPISKDNYTRWVNLQGTKNRYIVTVLGRVLDPSHISAVAQVSQKHKLNIEKIIRLTGRVPLAASERPSRSCIELSIRGTVDDVDALKHDFMKLADDMGIDIAFQVENMYRRMRRLVCFDMDSTLIQTEVIDELAERAGVGDEVKAITEAAMRGEIDFSESFKKRVSLLKGLDESVMQDIAENLPVTEGMTRLIRILKKSGCKLAILSGGFTYFGNYLKDKYGFDYVYANELEIENGKLTGNYVGDIVDGKRKAELLRLLAQVEKVDIRQTVAVGDGANDLPMLNIAGLGIAFHAKPKVKANAKQSLSNVGLDGILYFLGYRDSMLEGEK
ncbi:MAG TPA: phosphoserine phosphatase SerB [Dysgonomonas sp.]|uniref:Phosphoserine phosphatase n=1 Tax=Dysgonomonas mossii TaxID=163665 RepID=A0A4Y9INU0_9BACT|nr:MULTISPECIES: phosphoserine phosphatase SerB [Dysgonomonas]MBF0760977.1 phosphoserine phosphatase SerB [Dysgonomonas mossii]TFU89936.1 phosphoserine phosphatase SerB [Dysgonomonas mossii]HML63446.1 phosphoserine phosphatase SerB [Dysgonomonas sp.]